MLYRRRITYRRNKRHIKRKKNGKGLQDLLSCIGKSYWQAVRR